MTTITSEVEKTVLMRACGLICFRISCVLLAYFLVLAATDAYAQVRRAATVNPAAMSEFTAQDFRVPASSILSDTGVSVQRTSEEGGWTSKKQALLIGGVTTSVAAYGYFVLAFNNSRSDAIDAERIYEEDVRQNAQRYVDEGVALDQIQTYRDWQKSFDDAANSREWAARAGFFAFLIGFFAILDAATSHDGPSPGDSGMSVRPTIGFTAATSDVVVGARLRF